MKQKRQPSQRNESGQLTVKDWNKPFPITSVCRADLRKFYSDEEIEQLTDKDMLYIARKMADAYVEEIFWLDLETVVDDVMGWM